MNIKVDPAEAGQTVTAEETVGWNVPFDWDAPLSREMSVTIAKYGDNEMRLRLLDHPQISRAALLELLDVNVPEIAKAARERLGPAPDTRRFDLRRLFARNTPSRRRA